MNDKTGQSLAQAFEYIESGRLQEAQSVLKPLLTPDQDNPDVWWVYAHAVADPNEARIALRQVLVLEPNYPGATELMATLENQQSSMPAVGVFDADEDKEPAFLPDVPATLPDLPRLDDDQEPDFFDDLDEDEFEEAVEATEKPAAVRRTRLPLIMGVIIAVIALIVIVALLLLGRPPSDTQIAVNASQTPMDSTSLAVEPSATQTFPTLESTSEPLPVVESTIEVSPTMESTIEVTAQIELFTETPTQELATSEQSAPLFETPVESMPPTVESIPVVTVESTTEMLPLVETTIEPSPGVETTVEPIGAGGGPENDDTTFAAISTAMSSFVMPENPVSIEETTLGSTLVVTICSAAGSEMRTVIPQAMDVAVRQLSSVELELDAVGIRAIDCADNTPLRTLAVATDDALAYVAGNLTMDDFQTLWTPAG